MVQGGFMKRIMLLTTLFIVMFPIFGSWELKTREVKDEFGDVTSKNDYYINGSWNDQYTDKFIFFFVGDNEFHNGYMAFGEQGSKSNETYTATVKIKEQDGTVQSFTCKGETLSNSSYWCCDISIDSSTAKKMIDVFSRNDSVKVSVTYGKKSETYNYGSVDCSGFINSPICMKLGHNFDAGVVSVNPTCMVTGTRTFTCINCGATQEKTIAALGHSFVNNECSRCAVGHKGQAGGIIFYDCDDDNESGNPDGLKSDECGWRYLEAAPSDIKTGNNAGFVFGYYRKAPEDDNRFVSGYTKYDETNCTLTAIGSGKKNTELLVKAMGSSTYTKSSGSDKTTAYAAKLCDDYTYGGYDDWFLPSLDELYLMYKNLQRGGLGGFASDDYWSSSEDTGYARYAWLQYFYGGQSYISRDNYSRVRPVRAF